MNFFPFWKTTPDPVPVATLRVVDYRRRLLDIPMPSGIVLTIDMPADLSESDLDWLVKRVNGGQP